MKHVMIVGQEPTILESTEKELKLKYKVTAFLAGSNEIEFLKNNTPDLLLLLTSALDLDGLLLYQNLTKTPELSEIPVIYIIDGNSVKLEQKVLSLGAADFITTPYATQTLYNRVDAQIELYTYRNSKTEDENFQDAISVSFAELVEFRDETTGGHLKNTTQYFKILLEEILRSDEYQNVISVEDIKDLLRSAPLHDIGKIGINDEILRKASSLNYKEFESMKTHTTLGKQAFEKIIQETGGSRWLYLAKDIAYCHHERWNGTGYPNGLKGEEIPIYARILTIADVYDALTSRRSYKDAYSHKEAVGMILEGKGSLFDPGLVDIFMKANNRFEQALAAKQENV
jgi:putative two-component system response regulator